MDRGKLSDGLLGLAIVLGALALGAAWASPGGIGEVADVVPFVAKAASAQELPGDVVTIPQQGQVQGKLKIGDSNPSNMDTASVAIVQVDHPDPAGDGSEPPGDKVLGCVAATPGEVLHFTSITVANPGGNDLLANVRARAYATTDCTGDLVTPSINFLNVAFALPGEPEWVPLSTQADRQIAGF